jgi:transposase
MSRIKEILRLKNMAGLSLCAIGRSVGCSHNTVKDILRRADEKGLIWEIAETLSDTDLEQRIYGEKKATVVPRPEPDLAFIDQELRRPGVNLSLLWHEYKLSNPNGVQYTQFCERYRKWAGTRQLSLHILHKAGEKLFVDWAGDTMTVIDPSTGEIILGYLFVCALGRSGYPYAEAFPTKEKEHWIAAHRNAFEYYRGVPLILVPDNDKSAVTRADKYDPEINKTYREMAQHYNVAVVPARVRKPKDKPKVEKSVKDLETWVMAALRNITFFSFAELNVAIRQKLAEFSNKSYQKLEGSRRSVFLEQDQPALQPLPPVPYEYADWHVATVNADYHVEVLKQFYSTPHSYARQKVTVRIGRSLIEIYQNGVRICSHPRLQGRIRQYATELAHMPENHKAYLGMNKESALQWAQGIGPHTKELVQKIFGRTKVEQQAYRSCMGLKRIVKTYGAESVEAACVRALLAHNYGCSYVEQLIKASVGKSQTVPPVIRHNNLRGPEYYREEGTCHAAPTNA